MIRDLHRILLTSVRGRDREPGEIRRIQNYIAPLGTPMERATFFPPAPPLIMDALSNWEIYLHRDERDPLVQLAVLKAQFELIHPFRDGNGRIGRMLVPLILYSKKVLSRTMFYISAYLENHREEYYARLLGISQQDNWDGWISFFLRALAEQADETTRKSLAIQSLYGETSQTVVDLTRSQYALKAVDAMFMRPVFKNADFITESQITQQDCSPDPAGPQGTRSDCVDAGGKRERTGHLRISPAACHHRRNRSLKGTWVLCLICEPYCS